MSLATEKKKQLAQLSADAKTLYADMEAHEEKRTPENREKFDKYIEDGKKLRGDIENLEALDSNLEYTAEPAGGSKSDDRLPQSGERKSFGHNVIESQQYKNADRSLHRMNPVAAPGLIKALYNTTDANGGYLVRTDRETEIVDIARQRPPSILDLIAVGETSVDAVEYIEITSRTNNAAVVPEWDAAKTAGAGDYTLKYGDKPQGDLAFNLKTATVKTIAEWIPASRQILNDAPNLRDTIDNELLYMLRIFFENQVINGSGSGHNFTGMMNWSGIQERTHRDTGDRGGLADDTFADTLRRALTDIRLEYYEPDGIILNPANAETLELEKDDNGNYLKVYDPVAMRIWRVRVIETQAQPAGHAMVGAFKLGAKMWDREQSNIRVGEPGNFFLQNAVAILAEMRAAFAVRRPLALEKVDLVP